MATHGLETNEGDEDGPILRKSNFSLVVFT